MNAETLVRARMNSPRPRRSDRWRGAGASSESDIPPVELIRAVGEGAVTAREGSAEIDVSGFAEVSEARR